MANDLQYFMQEIATLDAGRNSGLAGGSAGITGVTGANNELIFAVRRHAVEFAAEYSKDAPDHQKIAETAGQLEGALRSLHLTLDISEAKLNELLTKLDGFVQKVLS